MSSTLQLLISLFGLALIVMLANAADSRRGLRGPLHAVLVVLNLLFLWRFFSGTTGNSIPDDRLQFVQLIVLTVVVINLLLLVPAVRVQAAAMFPQRAVKTTDQGLTVTGFDPSSMVHMTALICCMMLIANTLLEFVIGGGLSGLAENFNGISAEALWTQAAIFVLFAFVGVGLGIRRKGGAALTRLGLRSPTPLELGMGVAMAFFLFGLAFIVGIIWQMLVPREVLEQQTVLSQEISQSVTTLTLGFMLAASAALGEEIAFRGALQPVFGLWPTAILFALIHTQYVLTPASILIFFVGLGFGWLRRKYNTTTAIVAHFTYDFTMVALAVLFHYAKDMISIAGYILPHIK